MSESYNQTVASPIVIHCLDGAVHSGVYVASAIVCEKMLYENQVNVFLTVKEIKHKRKDAIATLVCRMFVKMVLNFPSIKITE